MNQGQSHSEITKKIQTSRKTKKITPPPNFAVYALLVIFLLSSGYFVLNSRSKTTGSYSGSSLSPNSSSSPSSLLNKGRSMGGLQDGSEPEVNPGSNRREQIWKDQNSDPNYRVNRHLEMTSQKIFLERQRVQLENDLSSFNAKPNSPNTSGSINNGKPLPSRDFEVSSDESAVQMARELGRLPEDIPDARRPQDLIQQGLSEQQQYQEYLEAYRKEYARKYIENARKKGYIVELDDQNRVRSIRRDPKTAEVKKSQDLQQRIPQSQGYR